MDLAAATRALSPCGLSRPLGHPPGHPRRARTRTYHVDGRRAPGTEGGWRLLRGAVVGAAASTLTLGGHVLAGDETPAWTTIVWLCVSLAIVSTWLSAVRWTFSRLLAVLLVGQAGMHTAFVVNQPAIAAGHEGHLHASAFAETLLPTSTAMVAWHVTAAVTTALLLRRGEAWLCGVLDALALRGLRVLDAVVTVYGHRPQPAPLRVHDLPRQQTATYAWRQRGPPG